MLGLPGPPGQANKLGTSNPGEAVWVKPPKHYTPLGDGLLGIRFDEERSESR